MGFSFFIFLYSMIDVCVCMSMGHVPDTNIFYSILKWIYVEIIKIIIHTGVSIDNDKH